MKRAWHLAAPLLLLLSCGRGSSPAPPAQPRSQASAYIRALIIPPPKSLIPLEGDIFADGQFTQIIFNNLVRADYLGNLSPELADSWDISPDHREYTFRLHRGVRFHDGRPFTAADVVFTLEQLIRKAQGKYAEVNAIEGYDDFLAGRSPRVRGLQPLDEHTLRIRLKENFKYFLPFLSAEYTAIVPRDYAGMDEAAFRRHPVGTGPFRLVRRAGESRDGQDFTVFRFTRHGAYFAPTGNVETIDFYAANTAVAPAAMARFDILYVSFSEIPLFRGQRDFRIINSSPNIINFLILNPEENAQMRDRRVRQLIHYGIDREDLAARVFQRQAVPAHSMMPFGLLGQNPYYRIAYSRAATLRADLPPGKIRFTILTVDNNLRREVAEYIARTLARFNIEVQVVTVTDQHDYFANRIYNSGTSVMLGGIPDYPSSYHFLTHLVEPSGYYNVLGFSLPELHAAIRQLPSASTVGETRLLAQIGADLEAESLYIPLFYNANFFAIRSRVRSIVVNYGEVIDFAGLEVVE